MKYFIFILVFIEAGHIFGQTNPRKLIAQSYAVLNAKANFHYTASVNFKFFDSDDTLHFQGEVFISRKEKDTINHGYLWFNTDSTTFRFYDSKNIYIVDKSKHSVIIHTYTSKEEMGPIEGSLTYLMIDKYFLSPDLIAEDTSSLNVLRIIKDTIINNEVCSVIRVEYPNEDDLINKTTLIYIGKESHVQRIRKHKVQYQGNWEYYDVYIHKYDFNIIPSIKFSAKQIPKKYKINYYKKERKNIILLDSGNIAPVITGKQYSSTKSSYTINYYDKVTLLDFWYMGCMPCIKAIPELEKLRKDYSQSKLQIFGINSKDNNPNGIKRLPQFLNYNTVSYEIMFVEKDIPINFKIEAWPTIYIIDQKGKVFYKKIGYSENLSNELREVINKLLHVE